MWYGQVEGTDIVVLDKRFSACFAGHVRVERLYTGCRWAEGPVWFAAGRCFLWSDIPNNRIMRMTDIDNQVSVFREWSNNSNGNTVDNAGRLLTCEHLARRVLHSVDAGAGREGAQHVANRRDPRVDVGRIAPAHRIGRGLLGESVGGRNAHVADLGVGGIADNR